MNFYLHEILCFKYESNDFLFLDFIRNKLLSCSFPGFWYKLFIITQHMLYVENVGHALRQLTLLTSKYICTDYLSVIYLLYFLRQRYVWILQMHRKSIFKIYLYYSVAEYLNLCWLFEHIHIFMHIYSIILLRNFFSRSWSFS